MTILSNTSPTVRVQAVGKVTKCRDSGTPIMFIKAVSLSNRKETQENEKGTDTRAVHVRGSR